MNHIFDVSTKALPATLRHLVVGDPFCHKYEVTLDGGPVRYAVEANAAEGWVDCFVFPFEKDEEDNMKIVRINGQVRISKVVS